MKYFSIVCLLALPCFALAQSFAPKASGLAGDMLLGVAVLGQQSLVSANDNSEAKLTSLNDKAESTQRVMPALMGNVTYTFDGLSDQVYAGVSRSNAAQGRFSGELGYKHFFDNQSTLILAYIPSLIPEDIWRDPYLVGADRRKTKQTLNAVRGKLERIGGTGFGIELGYGQLDVDDERSGSSVSAEQQALLRRNATYTYSALEFFLPLSRATFITPSLYYFDRDADGDANSYGAIGFEVNATHRRGRHTFVGNIGFEQYDHQTANPIFGQAQADDRVKLFVGYFFATPFGWQDTAFSVIASRHQRDSNIGFFDETGSVFATGLNYAF
ncbi:DUF2860 family protein [Simiduia curdlanivorans]|uniref:DUF2860 family protein n=1 Tax=Simiduia curdlanivorans TaxID=1492769 RepID=A0ABV8V5A7_9GAMM|nr:DUF2860 family protein [Simiduia curdlanivorans]MDN3637447.1 DUF2860 family protein [Simiduia curdlanivorans]